MPNVTIVKQFQLTHPDGSMETFIPGTYDMDDDIAGHWYVQAHSDKPPKAKPRPGTPHFARQQAAYEADKLSATDQERQIAEAAALEAVRKFREESQSGEGGRRRLRMPGEHTEGREGADQELVSEDEQDEREHQTPRATRRRRLRQPGEDEERGPGGYPETAEDQSQGGGSAEQAGPEA